MIKQHDRSKQAQDTAVITGDETQFVLNGQKIKQLLSSIHASPHKTNVMGHLVEISSFKGIISVMRELIDNSRTFDNFLRKTLAKQYFPFVQIIRFARNILSHSYDPKLIIRKDDFIHQRTYLKDKGVKNIHFQFLYADYIKERKGSKKYGIDIKIMFNKLKPGTPFYTAIPLHQCYLLCELSYNLTKIYK